MTEQAATGPQTVEAVVRARMAASLGGRRGMLEAAIPGLAFTVFYLTTKDLRTALVAGLTLAVGAVVLRLLQKQTVQFAMNAVVGIAIGWLFVYIASSSGGSESEAALSFFLPGLLYTTGYSVVLAISCLVGWPMIGFLVGSETGDPVAWHDEKPVVRLCTRLTWLFMLPGVVNVCLQAPVYYLGVTGRMDTDLAIAVLGVLRVGVGWAVRGLGWSAMIWLLARNATPLEPAEAS